MYDYARSWESPSNPDRSSSFRLPLEREQLEAVRALAKANKGERWTTAQTIALVIGVNVELKNHLVRLLWEWEDFPISTLSAMTSFSGQKLREIALSDPVSLYRCLDCEEPIVPHDRRYFLR